MYVIEHIRNGVEVLDHATQLAMHIYALENIKLDESLVFPYRSSASVQIGKYQNTVEEVNQEYITKNNIDIVRRETGGGAIYMDRNHANFVFIIDDPSTNFDENFDRIYQPTIDGLKQLGAKNVGRKGRNDLEIDGQKVSGAAVTIQKGRLYAGYSLLLDIDFDAVENALRPNRKKIESKGIKSVRRRVTPIRSHLAKEYQDITVEDFEKTMLMHLCGVNHPDDIKYYRLSEEEWAAIDKIAEEKFANWDWNYGKSPRYDYNADGRFEGGTVSLTLSVDKGRIQKIRIYGDFFGKADIKDIENTLIGTRVERKELLEALTPIELNEYFGKITAENIVDLILEQ